MIKYLGSKRLLAPVLGRVASAVGATTALDLFTGTTRVAQELKRCGVEVTAVDVASYSEVLARCFVATDARDVDPVLVEEALRRLAALPGRRGYVTETFCERARYFRPANGMRIDAIREAIEAEYAGSALHPILLAALLLAADRVDSTTGVQMAYLKQWAPRSGRPLELRPPALLPGGGAAVRGDLREVVDVLPAVDLAYLDPPYNHHRYYTNYHVWETLVRWDAPEHYGVACKRLDSRDPATRSVFNRRREMPTALRDVVRRVRADVVVVSCSADSWLAPDVLAEWLLESGHQCAEVLAFDAARYVGARIGIHDRNGTRVGTVGRLRTVEYLVLAGPTARVEAAAAAALAGAGPRPVSSPA